MTIRRIATPTNRRPYPTYEIQSLSDLIHFVRTHSYEGYATLYRGQPQKWSLLPKVARFLPTDQDTDDLSKIERRMFGEFRRIAISFAPDLPIDAWEVLAIAQHHGLPTRLLDWSYNPAVAAWFAVTNSNSRKPAIIWMHVPGNDDFVDEDERAQSPFKLKRYVVFQPRHVTARIRAQDGVFTAHAINQSTGAFPAFERKGDHRECMIRLEIPRRYIEQIRYDLDLIGIHIGTLFPNLDGLASKLIADQIQWKI